MSLRSHLEEVVKWFEVDRSRDGTKNLSQTRAASKFVVRTPLLIESTGCCFLGKIRMDVPAPPLPAQFIDAIEKLGRSFRLF